MAISGNSTGSSSRATLVAWRSKKTLLLDRLPRAFGARNDAVFMDFLENFNPEFRFDKVQNNPEEIDQSRLQSYQDKFYIRKNPYKRLSDL